MSVMMRNGVQYAGEPTDRLDNIEEIIGDGQQSVGSDLTDAVTQLNSSLTNTITAYGKGTYRLSAINNVYGYITSGGNNLYLSIPINIKPEVSNVSISELLLGLRIMPGGYAGGVDNFNALSYISAAVISKTQNMMMIYLSKSNGWGATNNTPTIGSGTITFTLS